MNSLLTPQEFEALLLSLKISLSATLLSLPFGIFAGWLLAKFEFKGKGSLESLLHLPLVLPPVVTGYGLLVLFGPNGPFKEIFNALGLELGFNWKGAVIASMVVSFPLMVNAIRLAFEAVDEKLEEVAKVFGFPPWKVFFSVSLPLAWTGLITGSMLAFARSLGEFGATITFVSSIPGETQTIPLALYGQLQVPGGEASALKLCVLSLGLALTALWLTRILRQRSGV